MAHNTPPEKSPEYVSANGWPIPRMQDVIDTCEEYYILGGKMFGRVIEAVDQQVPIIDRRGTGQVGVNMEILDAGLLATYAAKDKWQHVGTLAMQSLNILADHYAGDYTGAPAAQLADQTTNGQPIIGGAEVAAYSKELGLKVGVQSAENAVTRFGTAYLLREHRETCDLLAKLHDAETYTADDTVFSIKRMRPGVDDIRVARAGLASTQAILRDRMVLERYKVEPQTHYALLHYMRSLRAQGLLPEAVTHIPPNHPHISEHNKPQRVAESEFTRRVWAREVIPGKPGVSYGAGLGSVRRLAKEGTYTPLSRLYDTCGPEDIREAPLLLSTQRLGEFLGEALAENGPDPKTKLIEPEYMHELIQHYLTSSAHEDLPLAEYTMGDWMEQPAPALNLKRVVAFSEQLGSPIKTGALHSFINQGVANSLIVRRGVYTFDRAYIERGAQYTFDGVDSAQKPVVITQGLALEAACRFIYQEDIPQSREAFVLFKYLKALHQQGAFRQTSNI